MSQTSKQDDVPGESERRHHSEVNLNTGNSDLQSLDLLSFSSSKLSSKSNVSSILMKQAGKIEAARTRLKYAEKQKVYAEKQAELEKERAEKQAEYERQQAKLKSDIEILKMKGEVEAAEAELNAMSYQMVASRSESDIQSISPNQIKPINKTQQIKDYVENQRQLVQEHVESEFNHPHNPMTHMPTPKSDKFVNTPNTPINCIEDNNRHDLNPYASPFINSSGNRDVTTHNFNVTNELTKFLLKKELSLSRFTHFNDQPESFSVWKNSFVSIAQDLEVSPMEELDLLIKWLGPESRKHAISLRTANANNPVRGLQRIWDRLNERYGIPEMVESTLKKKLEQFPKVTPKDYKPLYELSDILSEIESIKEDPMYSSLLSYYDTSSGVNPVLLKLPTGLQNKWMETASKYKKSHNVVFPPFTYFVQFMRELSTRMNDPALNLEHLKSTKEDIKPTHDNTHRSFPRAVASRKTEFTDKDKTEKEPPNSLCPLHNLNHSLNDCRAFKYKPILERQQFLKDHSICYRCCDSQDHSFRTCNVNVKCAICSRDNHPTAMHIFRSEMQSDTNQSTSAHGGEQTFTKERVSTKCTQICGNIKFGKSCAKTLLVDIYRTDNEQNIIRAYAIIDDQSNASMGKPELFDSLGIANQPVTYTISSCSGQSKSTGRLSTGITVRSLDKSFSCELPSVIECHDLPSNKSEIATPDVAEHFEHLTQISSHIAPFDPDSEILILIGRDAIEVHHVEEQIIGPPNHPFAQKLKLGWVIIGDVCLEKLHIPSVINVNKTNILSDGRETIFEPCPNYFTLREHHKSDWFDSPFDNIGSTVFSRTKDDEKPGTSREDREFIQVMDSSIHKNNVGNWTAPLPFRSPQTTMPNNRPLALHRAMLLDNNLKRNPNKQHQFISFMDKVLKSGAAEEAPPLPNSNGNCWYLPIFGVYHPKKPDQIRGVFDSSAIYENTSLNKTLLTGPDLANNLLVILLRFRRDEFAITADIEQMFYSFFVSEQHRDFLRFFWYKENNPQNELIEFRMCVHVFGNSPSPAVATYGLRRAVKHCPYGSDVTQFVEKDFYVDDALTSLPSTEQAVDLIKRTQQALKENGNIRLHKIASNSEVIMNAFQPGDLSKDLKSLNLSEDVLPTQHSLGMAWDINTDCFVFEFEKDHKPYTRRGVLSTINSIFDPIGFLSPVTIHGKQILRELTTLTMEWDQPLPSEHESRWLEWRDSLVLLNHLRIPRMYLPTSLTTTSNVELHVYSDASEQAISAVAYLKSVSESGSTHYGFVLGKSKLAPKQGHTIPRLELCAAVMAVELAEVAVEHLEVELSEIKFFTDSRVVLGYVNNRIRRFYTYVSNRVERILRFTKPEQWSYVSSCNNPADQGSRHLLATNISDSKWLLGPTKTTNDVKIEYSHTSEGDFPLINPHLDKDIRPIVEVKKTVVSNSLIERFNKFSSWKRLVDAIALLKRVAKYRTSTTSSNQETSQKSPESFKEAELFIIKQVQLYSYSEEIRSLHNRTHIPRNSSLRQLNPYLDENDVLRIGGRLNNSNLAIELKNPIIVPGKSYIATLLVSYYHERVQHQGRHITEGSLRNNGLWIVGAKRLVSSVIQNCFKCRRLRGPLVNQIMSDLPVDRVSAGTPFQSVGVDVFGPWNVITRRTRGGSANNKRWAVLFTCLSSRAVHIEVVEDMSSSAFINALRRFVAIRGDVVEFRSDRGTNFVGAADLLKINTVNVEDKTVKNFLYDHKSVWIFNAPHSSHMGGIWERMIGVTRRILDSLLLDAKNITHDVLVTFMAEASAIINSRPITTISTDPEEPMILSPSLLLTHKPGVKPASSEKVSIKETYHSQWKNVQFLSDMFWKNWKDQYLQSLQSRRKWIEDKPNIKVGDVILLKDKDLHRNEWPLGIVTRTLESEDNKVRKVVLRVVKDGKTVTYTRPITELVLLID